MELGLLTMLRVLKVSAFRALVNALRGLIGALETSFRESIQRTSCAVSLRKAEYSKRIQPGPVNLSCFRYARIRGTLRKHECFWRRQRTRRGALGDFCASLHAHFLPSTSIGKARVIILIFSAQRFWCGSTQIRRAHARWCQWRRPGGNERG